MVLRQEGFTIMIETMLVAVAVEDLLCAADDDDIATDDALHLGCPIWHAPAELARDSGSMSLGTSLL
jgi:hypothetical protein